LGLSGRGHAGDGRLLGAAPPAPKTVVIAAGNGFALALSPYGTVQAFGSDCYSADFRLSL